ncbi:Prophage CP4-57 integrase [compost metagenome]
MPLTDTAVRQAKPAEKDFTLTDGSGLSLFIAVNGTKSWHFRFSWHGKQPRMSLGAYPEITLKEARELRGQARALVAKGVDPRSQRREEKRVAAGNAIKRLRWSLTSQFDLDAPLWTIPPDTVRQLRKVIRSKGGDEVTPYLVPLSRQAVVEVRKVHQLTGCYKLLIAGRSDPLSHGGRNDRQRHAQPERLYCHRSLSNGSALDAARGNRNRDRNSLASGR